MIFSAVATFSSLSWEGTGASLANHLWQSTVFGGVVWLLTLLLRRNSAQTRYCLWLVASAKFLLPFSLLVGLGSHLRWSRATAVTQPKLFVAMEAIGQLFSSTIPPPITTSAAPSMFEVVRRSLPTFLPMVWFAGCVAVLVMWCLRWRRLRMAKQAGLSAKSGRELEALRLVKQSGRRNGKMDLILSESALEPGILGIFRPVLLLPAGISKHLTDPQLESVIAHELCHVRRRDNLAAALHMLVEAIFWFHPLVWWVGTRLVDERERACDEDVLRLGTDPHVYAEGILKVCRFYLESPLFCAAGVTGSNLRKRIEAIMVNRKAHSLEWSKKLLISAAGLLVVVIPIAFGLVRPAKNWAESQALGTAPAAPMFESAIIRPNNGTSFETWIMWKANRFMVTNFTLQKLIQSAYGIQSDRISGGPGWLNSQGYDIDAKADESVMDELHELRRNQGLTEQRGMLQALLADRFKLALHRETKEVSAYALVIAKNGAKLQEAMPGDTYPNGFKDDHGRPIGAGSIFQTAACKIVGQSVPIADLVAVLSERMGRTVLDETGLKGNYDFTLDCFAPLRTPESEPSLLRAVPEHAEALTKVHAIETASLLEAVSEQLGLELNVQTVPLEVLVIDHAEKITGDQPSQSQSARRPFSPPVRSSSVTPHQIDAPSQPQEIANSLKYEIVSIKPDNTGSDQIRLLGSPEGITAANVTLQMLIGAAYGVQDDQIVGAPKWVNSENYDVEAKMDTSVLDKLRKLGEDQRRLERQRMLQALLADRFKLVLHRETREISGYALVIAKSGPKLQEAKPGDTYPNGLKDPLDPHGRPLGAGFLIGPGTLPGPGPCQLIGQGVSIAALVGLLSERLSRSVIDETGLKGNYDFSIDCQKALMERGGSVWTVLLEELGLELKSQTAPVEVLVIDQAERPSENHQAGDI